MRGREKSWVIMFMTVCIPGMWPMRSKWHCQADGQHIRWFITQTGVSTQYCAKEYQALHQRHGVICSMTDGYDCYQNALAEWVNGILKMEYLLGRPEDIEQARTMVKQSVEIYNTRRPHLSLQYKTLDELHRAL